MATKRAADAVLVPFTYHTIRNVTSPEDTKAGRRRFCGVAPADSFFGFDTSENVRAYLGNGAEGKKRKPTKVNRAILDTLETQRDVFSLLNSGVVMVARDAQVDDGSKRVTLLNASIINGAQTQGVLTDYFAANLEDKEYPSVNFELIVTDDEELVGEISIARNFQNEVQGLSIYGRQGWFDELEKSMQKTDRSVVLRKSETDLGDEFTDTEKLVQVVTAMAPKDIPFPSTGRGGATAQYRVYAYSQRSRSLSDFAQVMDKPKEWTEAHEFVLDVAAAAWKLYHRLKGEQFFSRLVCVKGDEVSGNKQVAPDGVPDGIVFPMLSALSRFVQKDGARYKLDIPARFPWKTFYQQAYQQETNAAQNNPQTMGKSVECYIALHGSIDMFFAMNS
jgi:hypothetical protein